MEALQVKLGRRLGSWIFCASIVATLPVIGSTGVAAASPAPSNAPSLLSSHAKPFLAETPQARAASRSHTLKRAKSRPVTLHSMGNAGSLGGGASMARSAPLVATQSDKLAGFSGASQVLDVLFHGNDQNVAPPDPVIAVGPSDVVEVVNSSIYVYNRGQALIAGGTADLNTFLGVESGHFATDPRILYDAGAQRWWLSISEAPNSLTCPESSAPVLIAVSTSSNPLPFTSWIVYGLPFVEPSGTAILGDQPGLGFSNNTVAVTFNDYNCSGGYVNSEVDILQKSDLEHNTGTNNDAPFYNVSFGLQPVESLGSTATQYVVANDSDCAPSCVPPFPAIEVDAFDGTPENNNVTPVQHFLTMTPTMVGGAPDFVLPPAQQKNTSTALNTDDDRFLNAVWGSGMIWTAGGTQCTPTSDTAPRSCLDYVGVAADSTGNVSTVTQINNVGVLGSYLYYPAVSLDSAGNMFTVFDESSSSTFPTIMDATIASGGSTLSAFQTLHTSTTFFDPASSGVCQLIGTTTACRWGDYSGATQDPSNPNDVWVVSEAEDGAHTTTGFCLTATKCWGTDIALVTLAPPIITALNPASGPVSGGQTVTVSGLEIGKDTTATFGGSSIPIISQTQTSFTFVTPPGPLVGGTAQVQASDALGTTAALTYTYVGLANYAPVTPFRILDTRTTGGPIGQGLVRSLQVTGVGTVPIPASATAAVLNVTEVSGSASSLLTVYPYNTPKPTASNLNFPAHTVIANLVTVTLGANSGQGWINIYNGLGSVNVLVDVEGYFTQQPATVLQGLFHPIIPVRVCDTRSLSKCGGNGAVGAGKSIVVTVATAAGIPADGTAEAAVVNLTGVAGSASTYLSLFPTDMNGHCIPTGTSTINLLPGAVAANRVMVTLGPTSLGGPADALCVFNAAGSIDVLVDANGWYGSATATASPTGYQYQALAPTRICDTRFLPTSCSLGAIGAGKLLQRVITVAGHAGVPAFGSPTTVVAIIANLTGIAPTATTYLSLYPANLSSPPGVSDLNLGPGAVLPNLAVVEVDTVHLDVHDGEVYLYNGAGSVNAILDLEGWFQ
jgi:IPT/TIG domain